MEVSGPCSAAVGCGEGVCIRVQRQSTWCEGGCVRVHGVRVGVSEYMV